VDFKNGKERLIFGIDGYAYKFDRKNDEFQNNWLNVRINYELNGRTLSTCEPCLLTWEIEQMIAEVRKAKGKVYVSFLEGHLSFGFSNLEHKLYIFPDFYLLSPDRKPERYMCNLSKEEVVSIFQSLALQYPKRSV